MDERTGGGLGAKRLIAVVAIVALVYLAVWADERRAETQWRKAYTERNEVARSPYYEGDRSEQGVGDNAN